jgi:hypothetical protein
VKVYDIEYSWLLEHEDLRSKFQDVSPLVPEGMVAVDPDQDLDHGTAVLGELFGSNNNAGVKGIAYDAAGGVAAELTNFGSVRPQAILLAVRDGKPGDVILLEMQICVCNNVCPNLPSDQSGFGPAEWERSVYEATKIATAVGFVVVAAAGNGNVDLDSLNCEKKFDLTHRDSGAIIVGAGAPPGMVDNGYIYQPREKMDFSSYGSRVDAQGWGSLVVTTGYGDLYSRGGDTTSAYTQEFAGTSSA